MRLQAATETGRVSPAPTSGKNVTSPKSASASTGSTKKDSESLLDMDREVEGFEEEEAELEAEMAGDI